MSVHPQHSAQHSLKEEKKVEAKLMEKKPIIWTYNKVLILMQILRAWIERDVPASQMGIFLVEILYQTDRHMNSRVTRLVECNETYENIAKSVSEYFQIRDEWHQPLWTKLISGDPDLRPGLEFIHESTIEELSCSALLQEYAGNILFAPKPLRYVHWPFFPSKEELRTTLSGKDSEDDDLNELNSHTDGDMPCYGAVKTHTPALSQTEPLPILQDFITSGNYTISPYLTHLQQPIQRSTPVRKSKFLGNIIGTRASSVIGGEYLKRIRQSHERPFSSLCIAA